MAITEDSEATPQPARLSSLELHRFKGFRTFTVSFGRLAVLIGPNNAGKTSVVGALAATSHMLRVAMRFRALARKFRGDRVVWAHEFTTQQVGLEEDSLRWESKEDEVQLRTTFSDGSRLVAVWPPAAEGSPFFFVQSADRKSPRDPAELKRLLAPIDVIPALSPLERTEDLHDERYVRDSVRNRYASRNFGNQLLLCHRGDLPDCDWSEWGDFLRRWLPEIVLGEPELGDSGINVYYRDEMAQAWKEIVWAGDGFQVFLQDLFHLYRLRRATTIVLDEPDVYLHADLQRRLIQAAEEIDAQLILATHSSEIAAEVGTPAIVWMDRTRTKAIRAPSDDALARISGAIGSQFNLRLARTLRAKLTLFVEGDDAVFLKRLAKMLGCNSFANERNLAIVPIEGRDNWRRLEGLAWLNDHLLFGSVESMLIVDRDYHSSESVQALNDEVNKWGVKLHVWSRKELESYLLGTGPVARAARLTDSDVDEMLAAVTQPRYEEVLFQMVATWKQDFPDDRKFADSTISRRFVDPLRSLWKDPLARRWRCSAKDCLSELNQLLTARDGRAVSFDAITRQMHATDIADEVTALIRGIEKKLK